MRLHAVRVVAEGWDDEGNEVRSVRSSKSWWGHESSGHIFTWRQTLNMCVGRGCSTWMRTQARYGGLQVLLPLRTHRFFRGFGVRDVPSQTGGGV